MEPPFGNHMLSQLASAPSENIFMSPAKGLTTEERYLKYEQKLIHS